MDRISVIVPVYNVKKYLDKCIESILNQTYEEFELILVDDGSTDESGAICDKYQTIDSRVKAFHIENGGVSRARNYGIQQASGQWIAFADSDDYIESDMYEKLLAVATSTDADIVACGYFNNDISMDLKYKEQVVYTSQSAIKECITDEPGTTMCGAIWNKLFKKSIITDEVRFESHIQMAEDMLFLIQCIKKSRKIVHYPYCGYHYVMRQDSMVSSFSKAKCSSIKAHKLMLNEIKDEFPQLVELVEIRSFTQAYHIFCGAIISKANLNDQVVVELKKYLNDNWSMRKRIDFSLKDRLILWCSVKMPKGADILQRIYWRENDNT